MRMMSRQESDDWLKAKFHKGFSLRAPKVVYPNYRAYPHYVTYLLPTDTGKKTGIARILSSNVDATEPGLLLATEWGIWPSSENMALFDGYRKSLGESRSIGEAPGHLFDGSELTSVECLLDFFLYFYWGGFLVEGTGSMVVVISHDELFAVYMKDQSRFEEIKLWLDNMNLESRSAQL